MTNLVNKMPTKITNFEQKMLTNQEYPDYQFELTLVPPNIDENDIIRHTIFDDRSIDVDCSYGSVWLRVTLRSDPSKFVAQATFGVSSTSVVCDLVEVAEEYRLKGLGRYIYRLVEDLLKMQIKPSNNLLDDGRAFWEHWRN